MIKRNKKEKIDNVIKLPIENGSTINLKYIESITNIYTYKDNYYFYIYFISSNKIEINGKDKKLLEKDRNDLIDKLKKI